MGALVPYEVVLPQNLWFVFKKNSELCSVQVLQFQMRPAEDLGGRLDLYS